MNKQLAILLLGYLAMTITSSVNAGAVDALLDSYRSQATLEFSAERGQQLWLSEQQGRRCGNCHTDDPRSQGKHQKTGKPIKPLAPSANPERLTSIKSINKWLKRNCKWTLERECSVQEKGDFLTWLQTQ